MKEGTVMAFDFGLRHIGVAVGQPLTGSARGVATLAARDGHPVWRELLALLGEYRPAALLVGLPLNMDGSPSDMSRRAEAFADELTRRTAVPVATHDERLSSREAQALLPTARALAQANTDHELAACLIAESWMRER